MGPLGISLSLISLGAQALGLKNSAEEQNAIRRKLLERSDSLNNVFNRDMNMDYMETSGVKNTLAAYGKEIKKVTKDSEGRAAMAGASPESQIAEKQAITDNYGNFIRKIAAGQDAYRADKERVYQMRRDSLDSQIAASDQAKASQWDNFTSNAVNLGVAGISAGAIQDEGKGSGDFLKNLFKKSASKSTAWNN